MFLRYSTYRVLRPHCRAVHTSRVPWASHGSRFTHRFEEATAWFALQMNKSATSSYMRIAWRSVGEIMSRVKDAIAATTGDLLDGLTCIGIDETSYCKGHKYMLVIRMAYGFRNTRNMLDMVLMKCGCYKVQLPWEKEKTAA